jgi:hypothetical protein
MIYDPYRSLPPSWVYMQEHLAKMDRIINPKYLKTFDSAGCAARLQSAIDSAGGISRISETLNSLSNTVQGLQCLHDQHATLSAATKTLGACSDHNKLGTLWSVGALEKLGKTGLAFSSMHPSWLDDRITLPAAYESIQLRLGATIDELFNKTELISRIVCGVDFDAIENVTGLPAATVLKMENSFTSLIGRYDCFASSFRDLSDIIKLPSFVLPGAAREVLTTSQVVKSCATIEDEILCENLDDREFSEVVQDVKSDCIGLLSSVDPDLVRPYMGAWESLNGDNSDRSRHILTSLRELWSHLLRRLAPNEQVLHWIVGKGNDLIDDNGNPTRRAKTLYICREIDNDPLKDFICFDIRAFVKMLKFLNSLHELKQGLTDVQLRRVLIRTDSYLMFILQIRSEPN